MATILPAPPGETRTEIDNVTWDTFVALSEERRGGTPRMTYDQGMLELMSPGFDHESIGRLIGRVIETYTEVRGIDIRSVARTTIKRRDLQKAYEADESYYVTHSHAVQGKKKKIDLSVDPPPDLVVEVALTASLIQKLKLFAAIGIPEVWQHDGERLEFFRLRGDRYEAMPESVELPGLTAATVQAVLERSSEVGETQLIREFRASLG